MRLQLRITVINQPKYRDFLKLQLYIQKLELLPTKSMHLFIALKCTQKFYSTIMKIWYCLLIFLALSSSGIVMAARSRHHHHHRHHHGHVKSRETVHFKPRIPAVPSPSVPWIVPGITVNRGYVKYLNFCD